MWLSMIYPISIVLLMLGLVALYFGAEWLVCGGASLAVKLGFTPLLVGLTVVAYGTSAPELVVSCTAAVKGQGAIAIGNAVGSNILNIGLILGLTALVCPLRVQSQLLKLDTPIMVGAAALFLVFFLDSRIQLWEAAVLLAILLAYTRVRIRLARRSSGAAVPAESNDPVHPRTEVLWKNVGLVMAGLTVLVLGSRLFVSGAVDLARMMQVSEAVIGLTIVASGTSLPELASSVVAAMRKHPDIALGNVVGSNIHNVLAILGVSTMIRSPLEGAGISLVDVGFMVALSVVLLVIAGTGFQLRRWEGILLLALYGGYLWHLWPKGSA